MTDPGRAHGGRQSSKMSTSKVWDSARVKYTDHALSYGWKSAPVASKTLLSTTLYACSWPTAQEVYTACRHSFSRIRVRICLVSV